MVDLHVAVLLKLWKTAWRMNILLLMKMDVLLTLQYLVNGTTMLNHSLCWPASMPSSSRAVTTLDSNVTSVSALANVSR